METLLIVVHYFLCFFLIITILLQAGKGADIGAVFGGGSQTVFGSRGPTTFLNRLTIVVAFAFLVTSIWLAQISKTRSGTSSSVIDKTPIVEQKAAVPTEEQPAENVEKPVEKKTDKQPTETKGK